MLFWAALLILAILIYALLLVWALPKLILKSKYPITKSNDRGLKKYKFKNSDDYAIVYEPSLSARKYITQYILAKKDGKKIFKGKISPSVSYIDFDLALFNAQGKCFLIINSMQLIETNRLTKEVDLPDETAYASVLINQVNTDKMRQTVIAQVSKSRLVIFAFATLFLSICFTVCSAFAFSNFFGGLFKETFINEMLSSGWIFIFPTIISAICITIACYTLYSKRNFIGDNHD